MTVEALRDMVMVWTPMWEPISMARVLGRVSSRMRMFCTHSYSPPWLRTVFRVSSGSLSM